MAELTFSSLAKDIASGRLAPVYLLHGPEGFYVDRLVKMFENVVPEDVRDFNQYVVYAPETEPATVVDLCQRYPMMADRMIVVVKECQGKNAGGRWLNTLKAYAANPSTTTTLVLAARGEEVKCAELVKAMKAGGGQVFLSKKLSSREFSGEISRIIADKGLTIEPKAMMMLQEYIGENLSTLYNEVDKLSFVLGKGAMVTPEAIERNIGISKEYNNFELTDALLNRNAEKAFRIVKYFRQNPKNNPTPVTASTIFGSFSDLLSAYYAPDRSPRGVQQALGLRTSFQADKILNGMRQYNPWQIIEIIDAIRRFDINSKGGGSRFDPYDLLQQLIFTILTATGRNPVS